MVGPVAEPHMLKHPYRDIRLTIELLQVGLQCSHENSSLICDGSEFLVHAADVEGLCQGIDEDLVARTSPHSLTFSTDGSSPR